MRCHVSFMGSYTMCRGCLFHKHTSAPPPVPGAPPQQAERVEGTAHRAVQWGPSPHSQITCTIRVTPRHRATHTSQPNDAFVAHMHPWVKHIALSQDGEDNLFDLRDPGGAPHGPRNKILDLGNVAIHGCRQKVRSVAPR